MENHQLIGFLHTKNTSSGLPHTSYITPLFDSTFTKKDVIYNVWYYNLTNGETFYKYFIMIPSSSSHSGWIYPSRECFENFQRYVALNRARHQIEIDFNSLISSKLRNHSPNRLGTIDEDTNVVHKRREDKFQRNYTTVLIDQYDQSLGIPFRIGFPVQGVDILQGEFLLTYRQVSFNVRSSCTKKITFRHECIEQILLDQRSHLSVGETVCFIHTKKKRRGVLVNKGRNENHWIIQDNHNLFKIDVEKIFPVLSFVFTPCDDEYKST